MKAANTKVHLYYKTRNGNYLFGCKKNILARRVRLRGFRARSPNPADVTCPGCKRSDMFKWAVYDARQDKIDTLDQEVVNLNRERGDLDNVMRGELWKKLPPKIQKLFKNERATKKRQYTIVNKHYKKLCAERVNTPPRLDLAF